MKYQDYKDEVTQDALRVINEYREYNHLDLRHIVETDDEGGELYEALWLDDSVTGNCSGSYTFNSYKAEQNVAGIIWEENFIDDLLWNFGVELSDVMKQGPEALDVTARCLVLSEVMGDILAGIE